MKAAVFVSHQKIQIQELAEPVPGADEVLIRVTACGVCGTDVHIYHGHVTQGIQPPVVLGHEIAGVIEAVGPNVQHLHRGQNVCVDPVIGCGSCQFCHIARPNLCKDATVIGYKLNGGFAQFLLAPITNIYPLQPDTPPTAGILVETLACVLNGYDKLDLKPGRKALILGAGTVGLLWNQLLRRSPVTLLVNSEPVDTRRERAKRLGADLVIDPEKEDLAAKVREATPEGMDYVIDASGDPQAVEEGIKLVKSGGTFLIFGVCPADATVRINPHEVYQKEMRILGSKMPPYSLQRATQMILGGLINHEQIVTDTFGISRLPEAIDMFESARDKHIKMVIDPWKD
ncbi:MAG: alcohol dehydrogenase catalytic domain-containing protein [Planctomycetota bacterium]|nr:MAG: alcohol dehydrogenase catalytic domain-containing protein [Planctomycetota bacterium]